MESIEKFENSVKLSLLYRLKEGFIEASSTITPEKIQHLTFCYDVDDLDKLSYRIVASFYDDLDDVIKDEIETLWQERHKSD